jgi:hypothetical protein
VATEILEVTDRCDRCGAQAFFMAAFPDDMVLLFCNHHWHKHENKIVGKAVLIVDESYKINRKSESSV